MYGCPNLIRYFLKITLIILSVASSMSANAGPWFAEITGAGGMSQIGESSTFALSSNVTNSYSADNEREFAGFASLLGGYHFAINPQFQAGLGVEAGIINYGTFRGKVYPLVNVAPNFDTLQYEYTVETSLVMLYGQIVWIPEYVWHPYAAVAIGQGWNKMYSYSEKPTNCSSAAPSFALFRNKTRSDFAFTIGIGVNRQIAENINLEIGYLYVNTGHAYFNPSSIQTTSSTLKSGLLTAHLLQLGVSFA